MASGSEYVCLRGGFMVPLEPMLLLFELEDRGFKLTQDGDSLIVRPHSQLTRVDYDRVRRWKAHLLALVNYQPPQIQ